MNADIVQRLRTRHANDFGWAETEALMREAAGEIERLRDPGQSSERYWEGRFRDTKAENERLRAELSEYKQAHDYWEGRFRDQMAENKRLRAELTEYTKLKSYAASLGQRTYLDIAAENERLRKFARRMESSCCCTDYRAEARSLFAMTVPEGK